MFFYFCYRKLWGCNDADSLKYKTNQIGNKSEEIRSKKIGNGNQNYNNKTK